MLFDFDVTSCSRVCSQTENPLAPGDAYFSVLQIDGEETVRHDYSAAAWTGPPDKCLGWWRSRVPQKDEKPQLAPTDVMLNLFEGLADKPGEAKFRYVLGLLLVRRRVLRADDSTCDDDGTEVLTLFCNRRNENYELLVDEPSADEAESIQQRMIDLLYGDGPTTVESTTDTPATEAA